MSFAKFIQENQLPVKEHWLMSVARDALADARSSGKVNTLIGGERWYNFGFDKNSKAIMNLHFSMSEESCKRLAQELQKTKIDYIVEIYYSCNTYKCTIFMVECSAVVSHHDGRQTVHKTSTGIQSSAELKDVFMKLKKSLSELIKTAFQMQFNGA